MYLMQWKWVGSRIGVNLKGAEVKVKEEEDEEVIEPIPITRG